MKKYKIVPIVFMAMLIIVGAMYFVVPDRDVSEDENRTLASFPKFSFASLADGSYTSALNDYMTDQFPLRNSFIAAGEKISSAMTLRGGEVEMVINTGNMDMGEGEILEGLQPEVREHVKPAAAKVELADEADYNSRGIIISGNRAMELFGFNFDLMQKYATIVNDFKNVLPNVHVYSMMVPTSVEFYSPVKYHQDNRSQKAAIDMAYSMMADGVTTVDAYTYLAANADRYIYFRSDHHWTDRGAYQGYYAFCEAAGIEAIPEKNFTVTQVEGQFLGTLYRFTKSPAVAAMPDIVEVLNPPEVESCTAYTGADMTGPYSTSVIYDPRKSSNKYLAFLGGDHPLLHIVTNNKNGRRVLVLKDSFGNAFIPYLINHYEEIYAIDPRSASTSVVSFCYQHEIDDLIIENYMFVISNKDVLNGLRSMTAR